MGAETVQQANQRRPQPKTTLRGSPPDSDSNEKQPRDPNIQRRPQADRTRPDKLRHIPKRKTIAFGGKAQPLARGLQQILNARQESDRRHAQGHHCQADQADCQIPPIDPLRPASIKQISRHDIAHKPAGLRMTGQP